MELYEYEAYLDFLPWIEDILPENSGPHTNIIIKTVEVDADFLRTLFSGMPEKIMVNWDCLEKFWILDDGEKEPTLVHDVGLMRENQESLVKHLQRPVYEYLADGFVSPEYLILTFKLHRFDIREHKVPGIRVVIVKPKNRNFYRYLEDVKAEISKEVKIQLGL